jgi:hypothetical protein
VTILTGVLLLPLVATAQPPVEPQWLVGRWSGSWVSLRGAGANGAYHLTIEKVVGTTVYGRYEFTTDFVRGDRRGSFVGSLDGNELSWGNENKSRLAIDGSRMRGTVGIGGHMSVTLTKAE